MRVLIADDHPIVSDALATLLLTHFAGHAAVKIDTVSDGDAVLSHLESDPPDLLILDLHMPGRLKSLRLLEAATKRMPAAKIIVYTGKTQPLLALSAIDAGVGAYVLKSSAHGVTLNAISVVMLGGTFYDPDLDLASARTHPWNQLAKGEREVITAVARGETLQQIAFESGRGYKTVAAHKYSALRKLGLNSKTEIGKYLSGEGLDYLLD